MMQFKVQKHLHKGLWRIVMTLQKFYNYTKSNYAEPNPAYFGAGKGMNVVYYPS